MARRRRRSVSIRGSGGLARRSEFVTVPTTDIVAIIGILCRKRISNRYAGPNRTMLESNGLWA